uniref:UBX domain protein 8 n=1 Tax=Ornithorhynchus anatinus TaxID=9258 RepID=A0A6I8N345_ORNAN
MGVGATKSSDALLPSPGRGAWARAGARMEMAPRGAVITLLLLAALPVFYLRFWSEGPRPGPKELVLLGGRCFLFLALLTLAISVASPWFSSTPSSPVGPTVPSDEKERQQRLIREEQQEALREQARGYLENVLRPRQESRLRKQEERFYQLTGESWKLTGGHKLGSDEDSVSENANLGPGSTPNQEAMRRRRLPEPLKQPVPPIEQPGAEEVPILPEEPPEQADEVVTVALRGPSGRILRRRFLKSCNSQVKLETSFFGDRVPVPPGRARFPMGSGLRPRRPS